MAQKSKYTDHRTDNNSNSRTDKVMEPLTRLFTDLVEQLKLLTPSGHTHHNGPPITKGMAGIVISRWASTIAIGNMVTATTICRIIPRLQHPPLPWDQFQMEWTSSGQWGWYR